ncbi:MAG: hypothetical protein IJU37_12850 [Desulfovibrio sp.]|nr:hypothetical protein [Desulfovibrio sp.]
MAILLGTGTAAVQRHAHRRPLLLAMHDGTTFIGEDAKIMQYTMSTPWQITQRKSGYHSVKYRKSDAGWELTPEIMRYYQDAENVHFFTYAARKAQWDEWIFPLSKVFSSAILNGLKSALGNIKLPAGVVLPEDIAAQIAQAEQQG